MTETHCPSCGALASSNVCWNCGKRWYVEDDRKKRRILVDFIWKCQSEMVEELSKRAGLR